MTKQQNDVQSLGAMLRYRRPAGSRSERAFIKKHLLPLGMEFDGYGNLYKRIGDSPVLWSCHTDTVHRQGGRQRVLLSEGKFKVFDKDSNCLGADDTAGVWLMTQMIEGNVPGLYVFHRAEEVGGKGSEHFVKNNKALLEGIEYAIAFDRSDKNSIITHQAGYRCCSEDFSASFAKELGMKHESDSWGTFTDTANYVDDVGECTNLSVGYKGQHTSSEELDTRYLFELRDAMMDFNYKNLTTKRKPGEIERKTYSGYYGGNYGGYYGQYSGNWADFYDDWDQRPVAKYIERNGILIPVDAKGNEVFSARAIPLKKNGSSAGSGDAAGLAPDEESGAASSQSANHRSTEGIHRSFERLVQIIKDNPREVADFMEESGVTADDLGYAIYQRGGVLRNSPLSEWRGHNLKGGK